jgi:hypothetical protein
MEYTIKVLQPGRGLTRLTLDAADSSDAARRAEALGCTVLSVAPAVILDQLEHSRRLALPRLRRWRPAAQLHNTQAIAEVTDHITGEIQQIALGRTNPVQRSLLAGRGAHGISIPY